MYIPKSIFLDNFATIRAKITLLEELILLLTTCTSIAKLQLEIEVELPKLPITIPTKHSTTKSNFELGRMLFCIVNLLENEYTVNKADHKCIP